MDTWIRVRSSSKSTDFELRIPHFKSKAAPKNQSEILLFDQLHSVIQSADGAFGQAEAQNAVKEGEILTASLQGEAAKMGIASGGRVVNAP
ncbi:MAG: hypothetical protein IJX59_07045 [Clostridia bacterium]|nr:hypothetical protein [Clostridia bacterium]